MPRDEQVMMGTCAKERAPVAEPTAHLHETRRASTSAVLLQANGDRGGEKGVVLDNSQIRSRAAQLDSVLLVPP